MNDTVNKRYFIGDKLVVDWLVNHTNNSYDTAHDINLKFSYNGVQIIESTFKKSGESSQPIVNNKVSVADLQQGRSWTSC